MDIRTTATAMALLPTMIALRDEMARQHQFARPPLYWSGWWHFNTPRCRRGLCHGGRLCCHRIGEQSCVEAGTSPAVKKLLAQARQADVAMAPAADMFEIGAKVQVLKRGTMFALRAAKLHELYHRHDRFENIEVAQQKAP